MDPITNVMDYVDDVGMDDFTPDQSTRMAKHWHAFRDKKAPASEKRVTSPAALRVATVVR